jgi:predicted nucleic acid-binding protein
VKQVLVDTSVWIDFFREEAYRSAIQELAQEGQLATCGLIHLELLPFVLHKRRQVEDYFQQMRYLPFEDAMWFSLIQLREKILGRGENVGIPDLILIALCQRYDAILFTKDKDFDRLKEIITLDLFRIH